MQSSAKLYRSSLGYSLAMEQYDAAIKDSPVRLQQRYFKTSFGETHVLSAGLESAPPLILLHGWNGNAAGVCNDFPFLFRTYHVFAPDIIGHSGRSAPSRPPTAGTAYADWLLDVLDSLRLPVVRLVGISGGGWLALKLAGRASRRAHSVAAISTDGLSKLRILPMALSRAALAPLYPTPTTVRWFVELITSPNGRRPEPFERFARGFLPILKHFKTQRNPGLITDEELARISSPTLLLFGREECFFDPLKSINRAKRLIPGLAAAEIVANAGHAITVDQPEILELRISRFLEHGV